MRVLTLALTARRVPPLGLALGLAAALLVHWGTPAPVAAQTTGEDIVETARGAGQFSTLVTAVQAAGLVDTLKSPGPFTVLAPTDAAFDKLPAGTLDALLQNPEQLRAVLTYHVVSGRATAQDVTGQNRLQTLQGEPINVATRGGTVMLNNASVVQADIMASNGVIHVIDSVLLPPSLSTPTELPRTGEAESAPLSALAVLGSALMLGGLAIRRRVAAAAHVAVR